jgi:hypothetical protein
LEGQTLSELESFDPTLDLNLTITHNIAFSFLGRASMCPRSAFWNPEFRFAIEYAAHHIHGRIFNS